MNTTSTLELDFRAWHQGLSAGQVDMSAGLKLAADLAEQAGLRVAVQGAAALEDGVLRLESFQADLGAYLSAAASEALSAQGGLMTQLASILRASVAYEDGKPKLAAAVDLAAAIQSAVDAVAPPSSPLADVVAGLEGALEVSLASDRGVGVRGMLSFMTQKSAELLEAGGSIADWTARVAALAAIRFAFASQDAAAMHTEARMRLALGWALRALKEV